MNRYNKLRSLFEGATNVKPTKAITALEKRTQALKDAEAKRKLQDEIRSQREKNRKK